MQAWFNSVGDNGMASLPDALTGIFLACLTYGKYHGLRGVDPASSGDLAGSSGFETQRCGVGGGVSNAGILGTGSADCCTGPNVCKKVFFPISGSIGSDAAGSENDLFVGSRLGVGQISKDAVNREACHPLSLALSVIPAGIDNASKYCRCGLIWRIW